MGRGQPMCKGKTLSPWDWAPSTLSCAHYGSSISRTTTPITKLNTHAMEEMLNMETCPLLKPKLRRLLLYESIFK